MYRKIVQFILLISFSKFSYQAYSLSFSNQNSFNFSDISEQIDLNQNFKKITKLADVFSEGQKETIEKIKTQIIIEINNSITIIKKKEQKEILTDHYLQSDFDILNKINLKIKSTVFIKGETYCKKGIRAYILQPNSKGIFICKSFWDLNTSTQLDIVIHEMVHQIGESNELLADKISMLIGFTNERIPNQSKYIFNDLGLRTIYQELYFNFQNKYFIKQADELKINISQKIFLKINQYLFSNYNENSFDGSISGASNRSFEKYAHGKSLRLTISNEYSYLYSNCELEINKFSVSGFSYHNNLFQNNDSYEYIKTNIYISWEDIFDNQTFHKIIINFELQEDLQVTCYGRIPPSLEFIESLFL